MGKMRLNVREVAEAAGVSKDVVHRARRAGRLKAHAKTPGQRWVYFEPWDVIEWITHRPTWKGAMVSVLTPDEMVIPYDKPERYSPTPRPPSPNPTAADQPAPQDSDPPEPPDDKV